MEKIRTVCIIAMAVALGALVLAAANNSYAQNYRAKLDGKNEVPPLNTTSEGVINFKTKGDMMTWKMNVTGMNDATAVNIHQGKVGEKGDIIVDLMKVSKHKDTAKGMLMRGNVTDAGLKGALVGKTLADLQTSIANGDTYVNLVTSDHPDGELRGQIKLKGGDNATSSANSTSSTNNTS